MKTQWEDGVYTARRGAWRRVSPADIAISNFQPPGLGELALLFGLQPAGRQPWEAHRTSQRPLSTLSLLDPGLPGFPQPPLTPDLPQ